MKKVLLLILIVQSVYANCQNIDKQSALADFDEFIALLETQSSYYQVSTYHFDSLFTAMKESISSQEEMSISSLGYMMEKVLSETIDRHASVKIKNFDEDDIPILDLHFPMALAPLHDKVVGLTHNNDTKEYEFYNKEYPYLKEVNGLPINDFIDKYAYKRKKSPEQAKLYDSTKDLRDIGELLFKQNETSARSLEITLSNGTSNKTVNLPLTKTKYRWNNKGHTSDNELIRAMYLDKPFDFNKIDKWLEDSIAYYQIPSMFAYEDYPELETYIISSLKRYHEAKAMIIDIRGNGGGTRDILHTFSGYIIPSHQSPWVANIAYIRSNNHLDGDIKNMSSRYLYSYNSERLTNIDRAAIDKFKTGYTTNISHDLKKFSEPYFMILKNNGMSLQCPVYILVDERSFSAASVFASAFKGLNNVKIVGINTNGSSGRSMTFDLTNSNISIKLSTMLSFQRNGKTLDGNGTAPDITIDRDELQILGKRDTQLNELIELIKKK